LIIKRIKEEIKMTKNELFGTIKNIGPDRDKKTEEKYYKIPYFKDEYSDMFKPGEFIWVEEKIDGTNTSIKIDSITKEARVFGRHFELSEEFDNRGAYEWLMKLKDKVHESYGTRYTFFFEWLVHHNVDYLDKNYNQGYLISVLDNNLNLYLDQDKVYEIANELNVKHAPLLYKGEFKGWDHLNSILGTSELGAHTAEGIVVKAYDPKKGQKMIKIVTQKFKEHKCIDPEKAKEKVKTEQEKRKKVTEVVTEARIKKGLFRLIDDGTIKNPDLSSWSQDDKNIAIKNIGKIIFNDCISEEPEFVKDFGKDFGKYSFAACKQFIQNME